MVNKEYGLEAVWHILWSDDETPLDLIKVDLSGQCSILGESSKNQKFTFLWYFLEGNPHGIEHY
jgi:hypothetical protein